jgi:hypothetical protein
MNHGDTGKDGEDQTALADLTFLPRCVFLPFPLPPCSPWLVRCLKPIMSTQLQTDLGSGKRGVRKAGLRQQFA